MEDAASIFIYLPRGSMLNEWLDVLETMGFAHTDWCEMTNSDGQIASFGPCERKPE